MKYAKITKQTDVSNVINILDVMYTACGPWGQRVTSFIVAIYCFGKNTKYILSSVLVALNYIELTAELIVIL